jgi:integral membrane protein (TIGR01906 family)
MNRLITLSSILATLLTPVVLVLLGVRLLLVPGFPGIEYRMPGFPDDQYGFTLQDRLKWSNYSLRYLLNDSGINFLGDLRFDDGSRVFNDRELQHMEDVKRVTQGVLRTFYDACGLLIILGLLAWRGKWMDDFKRGLSRGGLLTVILILGLGVFAALSFWQFFTVFHSLFFQGNSWLFLYSDTLIRLFPLRFWQDVFLYDLGLAVILGAASWFFLKPRSR